jgi:hypothetical protein
MAAGPPDAPPTKAFEDSVIPGRAKREPGISMQTISGFPDVQLHI